jgi:hypothetical protein
VSLRLEPSENFMCFPRCYIVSKIFPHKPDRNTGVGIYLPVNLNNKIQFGAESSYIRGRASEFLSKMWGDQLQM